MVRSLPALAMLPVLTVGSAAGLAGTSRTSPRVALPQAFSVRVAPTWVSPSAVVLIQVEQPSTFDPQHPQGVHYSIVAEATVRPTSTSVAVPDSALLSSIAHKTQGRLNFIAETLNEATNAVAVQNFTTTLAGAPVVRLSAPATYMSHPSGSLVAKVKNVAQQFAAQQSAAASSTTQPTGDSPASGGGSGSCPGRPGASDLHPSTHRRRVPRTRHRGPVVGRAQPAFRLPAPVTSGGENLRGIIFPRIEANTSRPRTARSPEHQK